MKNHQYLEKYLDLLKVQNSSPRTIDGYGKEIKHFLRFLEEKEINDLKTISKKDVDEYQTHVYNHRTKADKALRPQSQVKRLTVLRSFFRALVQAKYLLFNPAQELKLPRLGVRLPKDILTARDMKKLLATPDTTTVYGYRDRTIMETLYSTGIRLNELITLKVPDADLEDGYLKVKGKGNKDRTVPLGKQAVNYMKEYLTEVRPSLETERSKEFLFLNRHGDPYKGCGIHAKLKTYAKKAGIKKNVNSRAFRVAAATEMLRGGAGLRQIQELLGHKNLTATQVYLRIIKDELKKAHRKTHPREKQV